MQKRLIAVLLSILMLLMLLPAAGAEEELTEQSDPIETIEEVSEPESTELPASRGIVVVDPADFDPDFLNVLVTIGAASESSGVYTIDDDTTEIDCGYHSLTSLRGIEKFTNLVRLNCQDNALDSIDVSAMPSLKVLDCHSNPLEGTISFHANLEELECWNSGIDQTRIVIPTGSVLRVIKVDVSQVRDLTFLNGLALTTLDCPYNGFTALDFTPWANLHDLRCDGNGLASLTVAGLSDLYTLRANDNELTSLDLSGLASLKELYVDKNRLAELTLPSGVTLDDADLDQIIPDCTAIDNNDGTSMFDLDNLGIQDYSKVTLTNASWADPGNSHAVRFTTGDNLIYSYDIGDPNHPMQVTVSFGGGNQGGQSGMQVNRSDFDPDFWDVLVDIGAAYEDSGDSFIDTDREEIDCSWRDLSSITGVNLFTNLKCLRAEGNQLTSIDLDGLHLEELFVNDNQLPIGFLSGNWDKSQIKTLEVAGMDYDNVAYLADFPVIETLNCSRSSLTALDVSAITTLRKLDCQFNWDLASLEINSGLVDLEMGGTQLNETNVVLNGAQLTVIKLDGIGFDLDILKTFNLTTLDVDSYAWGSFDFTPWPNLHDLRCDGSSLKSLTVAGLSDLYTLRANDNELTSLDLSGLTSLKELFVNGNALTELRLPNGVTLDEAELDQTVRGCSVIDNGDGTYSFDLGTLVTDLDRVTLQNGADWADPTNKGVISWTSQPTKLEYAYDTGDADHPMPVTVIFEAKVAVEQRSFSQDFWNWLKNNGYLTNENGAYSISSGVTELNCSDAGLTSLKGIGQFTNLEKLWCERNKLTSLDLSALDSLKVLYANGNSLAELLLSPNASLEEGGIDDQNLSAYDVASTADGHYSFDLTAMIEHPENVTNLSAVDAEDNPIAVTINKGVLSFDGAPSAFGYQYDTGAGPFDVHFTNVAVGPSFKSYSVTLEGMIGVNFYMDLSSLSDEEKQESYMEFTFNNKTVTDTFDPEHTNPNGNGYYGFTCLLTSIEMADTITATFCYRGDRKVRTQYSAQEYLAEAELQTTGVTLAAVQSVADYGHYVQEYLTEVNQTDDGHETIEAATTITQQNITAAKNATVDYAIQREPVQDSYIISTPFSLSVNDTITINLYVETEDNREITALLTRPGESEPEEMTVERVNGKYRVRIAGIKASELADSFIITLNAGGADMPVTVSALSYVQAVLTNENHAEDSAARKAVTAIYQYYIKTKAYVDAQNS